MKWKNGGGETVEIVVSPPNAALDAFDWRVSMATVATDGPFSTFAGIDRTLSVIAGEGIALSVAGEPEIELTIQSEPFAFPGDAPASARLLGGQITDLNVMTRRGGWHHHVERLRLSERRTLRSTADVVVILSRADDLGLAARTGSCSLGVDDAAILDGPADVELVPAGAASLFVIELRRVAR
jgi:environmental stress-induced protein Ves